MSSYYDMLIQQLMSSGMPEYGGEQGERAAMADASLGEDAMLRYQLGSKRKKSKNDRTPQGSYAQAIYPMLYNALDRMSMPGGVNPQGYFGYMSPEQRDAYDKKARSWVNVQGSMIPRGNFVSRM